MILKAKLNIYNIIVLVKFIMLYINNTNMFAILHIFVQISTKDNI